MNNILLSNDNIPMMVSKELVKKYTAIPIDLKEDNLIVAISKKNLDALEDFKLATGKNILFKIESEEKISENIKKYYDKVKSTEEEFSKHMFENILHKAVILNASDIHIEPFETKLKVRMRIDGYLKEIVSYNCDVYPQLATVIKLFSGMDIAEKRLPQDGRTDKNINGDTLDLRISTIPTVHGEKIVIRILNRNTFFKDKVEIGFSQEAISKIKNILKNMSGILLITGPTGSGKTTTLYSILNDFKNMDKNIVTIEDPIEYKIEGINQIQVNSKIGLDFSVGLKSILRQDPDIIMIGEIRDAETARIAMRAATTGHLVLSTMHTNNSVEAINRLVDMGIERYLIESSLKGVISQRLVRKVCTSCGYEKVISDNLAKGCNKCNYTGYNGRIAAYEIIEIDDEIKRGIRNKESSEKIYQMAYKNNMITFNNSCTYLLRNQITTVDECMLVQSINE